MTPRRWIAAALASVLLAACTTESTLSGSVGELFSLEVSSTEIRRNDEAFQVTYLHNRGAELDVVVRVTVALEGVDFAPGARIALDGEYRPGHARTTVVHAPGGEPVRLFPRVRNGDLHLGSGGQPGEHTTGDFSMSFESEGGDLGAGRTLVGSFSATALDGGFGP